MWHEGLSLPEDDLSVTRLSSFVCCFCHVGLPQRNNSVTFSDGSHLREEFRLERTTTARMCGWLKYSHLPLKGAETTKDEHVWFSFHRYFIRDLIWLQYMLRAGCRFEEKKFCWYFYCSHIKRMTDFCPSSLEAEQQIHHCADPLLPTPLSRGWRSAWSKRIDIRSWSLEKRADISKSWCSEHCAHH